MGFPERAAPWASEAHFHAYLWARNTAVRLSSRANTLRGRVHWGASPDEAGDLLTAAFLAEWAADWDSIAEERWNDRAPRPGELTALYHQLRGAASRNRAIVEKARHCGRADPETECSLLDESYAWDVEAERLWQSTE